jgi:uncharacterized protein YfiM (DUF2279 family)
LQLIAAYFCSMRFLLLVLFLLVNFFVASAQILHYNIVEPIDSIAKLKKPTVLLSPMEYRFAQSPLTKQQIKNRIRAMKITYPIMYVGILGGLSKAWYGNFEKRKLGSFNDFNEWKQVDKLGHLYGTYIFSKAATELWRGTGISKNKQLWYGGLSGLVFQTAVEILDGYSAQWGFSWSDMGANVLGSSLLIAQEAAWQNQRIELKMGFSPQRYNSSVKERVNSLYGTNPLEQFVKDYNAQTIWISANVHDFFKHTKLPKWLNISFGYGANGMLGANNNIWKNSAGSTINRTDIKRVRQFYLAPDIKLTKIKVRKQWQRVALTFLNAFKFPLPAIELNSQGKFKLHAIKF